MTFAPDYATINLLLIRQETGAMTMHLQRGLTTLNTKKPKKKKLTLGQISKYEQEMRKHNKYMKKIGAPNLQMNLEQYIAYVRGEHKPRTKPVATNNNYTHDSSVWQRPDTDVPSLNSEHSFAPCTKKESLQYTGKRRLVGIATMHKSNMVPVFADEDDKTGSKQATEIATMRRN